MDPEQDRADQDLVRRVAARDGAAFEALFRRYQAAAFGLARRITDSDALGREVLQDAFLALWRAPEAYDPARGAFRTFFLSLVHHRAVDTVRREQRLRNRDERALNLEPVVGEDVAEGVVDDAWLSVRRKQVRQALTELSEEQRTVLELAYFGGMTQARVADALGIPLGTVKTRTLAALRRLRAALQETE